MKRLYDHDLEELFNQSLNESCGDVVKICGYDYETARTFKMVDEIAYRCEFANWLDNQVSDGVIVEKEDKYYDPNDKIENDDDEEEMSA